MISVEYGRRIAGVRAIMGAKCSALLGLLVRTECKKTVGRARSGMECGWIARVGPPKPGSRLGVVVGSGTAGVAVGLGHGLDEMNQCWRIRAIGTVGPVPNEVSGVLGVWCHDAWWGTVESGGHLPQGWCGDILSVSEK